MASFVLREDDFRKVYKALYKARVKWRPLGIELEIDLSDLDDIKDRYYAVGNDRCLEEVIRKWLKSRPKLQALIDALKSPTVDEEGVACDIEEVSPENCYVSGMGTERALVEEEASVTLYTSGSVGQECEKPIKNIACELVSRLDGSVVKCTVKKGINDKYEIRYIPTASGQHQLHVKVEGKHVKGSPFTVVVKVPNKKLCTPIRTIHGLHGPSGVAVNDRGEIIVAEREGHCVSIFSAEGEKIKTFGSKGDGPGQFIHPKGVAIDKDGNILVTDFTYDKRCIHKFSPDGKFVRSVGSYGQRGCMPLLQFLTISGIATSQDGRICVCDGSACNVLVLDSDLNFVSSFGLFGSGDGQLNDPTDAAFDSRGNVYVADCGNHRVQVFTADGRYLRSVGQRGLASESLWYPCCIAVDADDMVFVGEFKGNRVSVFTSQGQFVRTFGERGRGPGQFDGLCGITVDTHGLLYISDRGNNRLQIF